MKNFFILLLTAAFTLTIPDQALCQNEVNKSGTSAAQFLKIGIGARAMALGGAIVAGVDDIYSLYWNPAGITQLSQATMATVYTQWFADVTHQYIGVAVPAGRSSVVGLHAIFVNMDPMEVTTIKDPHGTGEYYDASDLALGMTYAARMTDLFAVGVTGKFIQQSIYNESASTFAFDVGTQLAIPYRGIRLGMHFSNFGGKLQLDGRDLIREYDMNPNNTLNVGVETRLRTQPWELPVNFRVGLAMDLIGTGESLVQSDRNRITMYLDGNHPSDAPENASIGLEYSFNKLMIIRSGYRFNHDVQKLFYGVGLYTPLPGSDLNVDYALASFGELDYIHVFSASITLSR
ncbi:MAG: PorV/PorQ family protein [Candidatus Marinimicrobia bacterium]|nr:PorV/PorQ family protein [Candidatus Neomarinimicrobiota bacterium]